MDQIHNLIKKNTFIFSLKLINEGKLPKFSFLVISFSFFLMGQKTHMAWPFFVLALYSCILLARGPQKLNLTVATIPLLWMRSEFWDNFFWIIILYILCGIFKNYK